MNDNLTIVNKLRIAAACTPTYKLVVVAETQIVAVSTDGDAV